MYFCVTVKKITATKMILLIDKSLYMSHHPVALPKTQTAPAE